MYLYFIKADNAVKIGLAQDTKIRLSALQTAHPGIMEIMHDIKIPVFINPRKLEMGMHKFLNSYHIRGEWFKDEILSKFGGLYFDMDPITLIWGDGGFDFSDYVFGGR